MIASRASGRVVAAGLLACALAPGCRTPAGAPPPSAFRPPLEGPAKIPDAADRAAADLARAALVSDPERTQRALQDVSAIESILEASDEPRTGLLGVARDLRNSTLDDTRAYHGATEKLLSDGDLDPEQRARLELYESAEPLKLASDRMRDAWMIEVGRAFNALAEPVGRSIMSQQLAPYRLGRSLLNYAVQVYLRESMALQERQALGYWKEYLARNPGTPEAEVIAEKVKKAQGDWLRLHRDRALEVARRALEEKQARLALVYSDRAMRYVPEDAAAAALRAEAAEQLLEIRDEQRRSLDAPQADPLAGRPQASHELAVALLAPGGDAAGAAERLLAADPDGPLADEARYVEAMALGEAGHDEAMWDALEDLAGEDPARSNMARHAAALVNNPRIDTYRAFREARSHDRWSRVRWVVFGPFYRGVPERGLPDAVEWVLDAPSIAENLFGAPLRLLNAPWARALPSARLVAATARNHLERNPQDPRTDEARDWLESYECSRGNYAAALAVVEGRPDASLEHVAELRELAAAQYLDTARRQSNLGMRLGMYNQVALSFPGSRAARTAGGLARKEADEATAQRIRISRGFLEENPEVAGPQGLGLRPELLDEDPANAELHPEGVTLLGGRVVEVSYLAPSGDEDDPPVHRRETLGQEQLSRVVSQLEETSYHNMLVDPDDSVAPDASRDLFFERVRLGLADDVDHRPEAVSSYAYRGLKERYGMVRAREPILPFDFVLQGSLSDLSIGAFPRMRPPRETPDAILYR